mmetsp:Transcript_21224/g.33519  ORF Transcript_21224/g.33519 Transcript_21224/m.33519 type:complete len:268 (+) Transcript_21224:61-864(+)
MKYNDRRNARKKKKAKTGSKKKAPSASTGVHDFDELLKRAEKAEDTFEFELAAEFYHKALEQQPNNTKVMDSMAECFLQLESANESRPWIDMARQLLNQSIALAPTENPSKWLNFAQLHEGNEALQLYSKGIEALTHALQQAAAAAAPDPYAHVEVAPPTEEERRLYLADEGAPAFAQSSAVPLHHQQANVGAQMLQRMGWQDGRGLGRGGAGMVNPVQADTSFEKRMGIGGQGQGLDYAQGGSYRETLYSMSKARFDAADANANWR